MTVALPEEDPRAARILFAAATPPGTSPFTFTLIDLLGNPDRYVSKLKSSNWSSVSASTSNSHPTDILGIQVVKGVNSVALLSGADPNCEDWKREWADARDAALGEIADKYGWIRQDHPKSPPWTGFIKFLDERDRDHSRYYALHCDFFGACGIRTCHNNLTAGVRFYSSDKPRGQDFAIERFDEQIASGIKVLDSTLVNQSFDFTLP